MNIIRSKLRFLMLFLVLLICHQNTLSAKSFTQQQLDGIHKICIINQLPQNLHYLKRALTIVGERTFEIENNSLSKALLSGIENELYRRGYVLTDKPEESDAILIIGDFETTGYGSAPEGKTGFVISKAFGFKIANRAMANISGMLKYHNSKKPRSRAEVHKQEKTKIKTIPKSWDGFSADEQSILMNTLLKIAEPIPAEILDELKLHKSKHSSHATHSYKFQKSYNIYLYINDQQYGPYPKERIRQLLGTRELSGHELAWHEGLSEWTPLHILLNE